MIKKILALGCLLFFVTAIAEENTSVADDVLFLVLGKMSIYLQSETGEHTLRDHHFVAEIMPKENGEVLGGSLTSRNDPTLNLPFNPEGRQFLAHGARVMNAGELHEKHPDGTYYFSYDTPNGSIKNQPLTIKRRETTDIMPKPATLSLSQNGQAVSPKMINPKHDLKIHWTPMRGNMKVNGSELADLVFVLAFDCFGNNIAHSGRPFNGKPYLTYKDRSYIIPAENLTPGMKYNLIVEQATADVERYNDVPGISTYATLTFLNGKTTGMTAGDKCPVK